MPEQVQEGAGIRKGASRERRYLRWVLEERGQIFKGRLAALGPVEEEGRRDLESLGNKRPWGVWVHASVFPRVKWQRWQWPTAGGVRQLTLSSPVSL